MTDQEIKQKNPVLSEETISDVSEEEQQLAAVTGAGCCGSTLRIPKPSTAPRPQNTPSPRVFSSPKLYPLPRPKTFPSDAAIQSKLPKLRIPRPSISSSSSSPNS